MTFRPSAHVRCALFMLSAGALVPVIWSASAVAQRYEAPRYGQPYQAPPPSYAGTRRALDGTPKRRVSPQPYYAPPSVRPGIWQGMYVGGHGGYSTGSATPSNGFDTVDMTGGALGAHIGFNVQRGDWVFGLEGDGTWNDTSGSRTFTGPTTVNAFADWTSSLRARIGYAYGPILFYATGGAAFADFDLSVDTAGTWSRVNETVFGYVAGAGLEAKLADNWSGRIEALHYGFNEKSFNFTTGGVPVDLGVTTIRAGLTYHFR
jgi:outer membrane immunogenic protein